MNINDKREPTKNLVSFAELDLGEVYEDNDGDICIKTSLYDKSDNNNCITFQKGEWFPYHHDFDLKVARVEAELVLKRNK